MSKSMKIIIKITIAIIGFISILVIYSLGGSFTPRYEITKKYLKNISLDSISYTGTSNIVASTSVNYSDSDLGIICGKKVVKLGCLLDISGFTLKEEYTKENYTIRHLIAPSGQYEVVVLAETEEITTETLWYVHTIRSTNPNVSLTRGIQIGHTLSSIEKQYGLKIKKNKPLLIDECSIEFSSNSGILTEVFIHV